MTGSPRCWTRRPRCRRRRTPSSRTLTLRGWLDLEDVTFSYPGAEAPVLSEVSFSARPGQTVAVIGSTGAGKSTLVNLVPRLFDATAGVVRVGGSDVRRVEPEALWSQIGLVPQKAYLFSGTVRSNLLHGKPDATEDELWQALETAQARDFVEALADGLDAPVTQGGTNFSGGQRQRLAIARALVRRPGDLPVRRLVLGPRPGHRRATAGGAATDDDRRHHGHRGPAGHHDHRRRPDPRARGRPRRRSRHPPASCSRAAPPTRRSSPPR